MVFSAVLILAGTAAELVPVFLVKSNVPTITSVQPLTPLELEGRDLYIREGCSNCHSQMIRPFRSETARYGEYSKAGEFVYDHPFLWGSKRTGPDLARQGVVGTRNYKDNNWHYKHMLDPQVTSKGSIMPAYYWLGTSELDTCQTKAKIGAMRTLGVPYPPKYEKIAVSDLKKQAAQIAATVKDVDPKSIENKEVIAIIAYLQRLGTDIYRSEPIIFEEPKE